MATYGVLLGLLALVYVTSGSFVNDEKRLTKYLLEHYRRIGRQGRPVARANDTLEVKFGLNLIQIVDVDYASQSVELVTWHQQYWTDAYLKWTPADFDGVDNLRVKPWDIFLPDITAYNALSKAELVTGDATLAVIKHDGSVLYIPAVKQRLSCPVPPPGSKQRFTCSLKYGSWTYDGLKLDLQLMGTNMDMSSFVSNPVVDVVKTAAKREVKHYDCCPEPYIDVHFNVTLQYKSRGRGRKSNDLDL